MEATNKILDSTTKHSTMHNKKGNFFIFIKILSLNPLIYIYFFIADNKHLNNEKTNSSKNLHKDSKDLNKSNISPIKEVHTNRNEETKVNNSLLNIEGSRSNSNTRHKTVKEKGEEGGSSNRK